ncbi:sensor histidine kinase [Dyadobacter luticola]|uniref:histidine kinase n=1 Tax=Dyadobacter luticola TaxID=1979387 RepID=A0A5R9KYT6_9BACT|nr:HAMP domain-containing sensor histidine kinase [Dyadobacter luticola]TLV01443.1 HAMP domain-containing histidine kinase [Dyadobacter luticola]
MKDESRYPFYQSLRFRFGVIFGALFLCFLMLAIFFLYKTVKNQYTKNFHARLGARAEVILEKTEISPLVIPLPQQNEYFLLTYQASGKTDTLFNNFPHSISAVNQNNIPEEDRTFEKAARELETGGKISITYTIPASELHRDVDKLRIVLFFYLPLGFILAMIGGYFVSGFLLKPLQKIISKANNINLNDDINLLPESGNKDELHALTLALNRMLSRIKKQSDEQNAFFASASHELRTPLSVMLTELQVLQTEDLPDKLKQLFASQITETQRLSKLVNDFLLMSQLKSGSIITNQKPVDLVEVLTETLQRVNHKLLPNAQSIKLIISPESADFEIVSDKSHLTTILFNLLDNAIKHGLPGSRINVILEENNTGIILTISNLLKQPIQDVARLHDAFNRENRDSDGFGLGLWIVGKLADEIGIKVEFEVSGTSFIVKLKT